MIPALLLWVAMGQQPEKKEGNSCPQYQHEVGFRGFHNCRAVKDNSLLMQCDPYPVQCEDDVHMVKEKEWQEMVETLRKLDLALRETICSNLNWKESISINGKTTACAKLKPNDKTGHVLPWEPEAESRTIEER